MEGASRSPEDPASFLPFSPGREGEALPQSPLFQQRAASTAQPSQGFQLIFPKAGVALSSYIREQPFQLLPGVLHKSSLGSLEAASNYARC